MSAPLRGVTIFSNYNFFNKGVKSRNLSHNARKYFNVNHHSRHFSQSNGRLFRNRSFQKFVYGLGAVVGIGFGTNAVYRQFFKNVQAKESPGPASIKPTKSIQQGTDNTSLKLTLFQFQSCPFCCKVRALLDFYGFSYDLVEVNSVTKKQIKWTNYRKVPILVSHNMGPDSYLEMNDSSVIMSLLESYLLDKSQSVEKLLTFFPSIETTKRRRTVFEYPNKYFVMYQDRVIEDRVVLDKLKEERNWRQWTDDVLVHILSPNVYRTPSEALKTFQYFSKVGEWKDSFSWAERTTVIYVGAFVMYFVGKWLKRKYKLKDDVRLSLFDACAEWAKAVGDKRSFMGGDQPNLADLSVYGVLSSIEGCDAFQDTLRHTNIGSWYYKTKEAVNTHAGSCRLRES